MPCAYQKCKDSFQKQKGIECKQCHKSFHRKCVKQTREAVEFVCTTCKNEVTNSDITQASLQDTSFLDFSDYEKRIKELEEEVQSLKLIIAVKDGDIEQLKSQVTANSQILQQSADVQQSADPTQKAQEKLWNEVPRRKAAYKPRRKSEGDESQSAAVPTSNRFLPLQNSGEDTNKRKETEERRKLAHTPRKPKVLILADSNGRYCGNLVREKLGGNVEVCNFFKPSAKISQVVESIQALTKDFDERDTVFIHGGSNDLQSKNTEIIQSVKQVLSTVNKVGKRTNVILSSVPARFDDEQLNNRGKWMNNVIDQVIHQESHRNIVVNHQPERWGREYFAGDGLHYNRKGKEAVCEWLCKVVGRRLSQNQHLESNNNKFFLSEAIETQREK